MRRHQNTFGYTPDFKNPKTFNEISTLADKLKARIYIATKLQKI